MDALKISAAPPFNDAHKTPITGGASAAEAAARLKLDHEGFTASLERVREFAAADDVELLEGEWNELETAMLCHMGAEEAFLLPGFAHDDPAEASHVLAEHTELRAQIGEVGLAVDLHVVQLASIDRLYRTMARHIARESRKLYPWATDLRNRTLLDAALRRLPDPLGRSATHDEHAVATLLTLIRVCRDGEQGYRRAVQDTADPDHRTVFARLAEDRARFARSLRDALRELGIQAQLKGSTLGSVHRAWIDAKSNLSHGGARAIVRECERGEELAVREYRQALRTDLPASVRPLVQGQLRGIRRALEDVRALAATAA